MIRPLLALFASIACAGCYVYSPPRVPKPAAVHQQLGEILEDGATERRDVLLRLGMPTFRFEGDRILGYRVTTDRAGRVVTVAPDLDLWHGLHLEHAWKLEYGITLVFDESDVLERHAIHPM